MTKADPGEPAPVRIAAELNRRYPTAWRRFDEARASRSRTIANDLGSWLTYGEMKAALERVMVDNRQLEPMIDATVDLYTFATWRITKGIYRFDRDLREALINTPLDLALPASLLTRLPEWAVYVETDGMSFLGTPIAGMVATTFDAPSGPSLIIVLIPETIASAEGDLVRIQLPLTDLPLRDQLTADLRDQRDNRSLDFETFVQAAAVATGPDSVFATADTTTDQGNAAIISAFLRETVPYASLLLYLCMEEPDIDGRPTAPIPKATKRGMRFFPPDRPQTWPVGVRIGATLRAARVRFDAEPGTSGIKRQRPHIRPAYWNLYWLGPRTGKQTPKYRWIMPAPVNMELGDDGPAVVRPVVG
jgi:hypothetical protein